MDVLGIRICDYEDQYKDGRAMKTKIQLSMLSTAGLQ